MAIATDPVNLRRYVWRFRSGIDEISSTETNGGRCLTGPRSWLYFYKHVDKSDHVLLFNRSFPTAMLRNFSEALRPVADGQSADIRGPCLQSARDVVLWTERCCQEGRLVAMVDMPFGATASTLQVARLLQIPELQQQMYLRLYAALDRSSTALVSPGEISIVATTFARSNPAYQIAVAAVARAYVRADQGGGGLQLQQVQCLSIQTPVFRNDVLRARNEQNQVQNAVRLIEQSVGQVVSSPVAIMPDGRRRWRVHTRSGSASLEIETEPLSPRTPQ